MQSTREDAAQAGEKTYFTGKPCVNGHTSQRYTHNCACVECTREASRKRYETVKKTIQENSQP